MTQHFCQGFDAGSVILAEMLRSGMQARYIRADIDVEAVADAIVGIPLGLLARYGRQPDYAVLAARVKATVDLACRGIANTTEQSGQEA